METGLPFSGWSDFYVIIGSASAALTGLQFVVMALASDRRTVTAAGARAFATPTIFHFSAVFVLSAMFTAPWHHLFWAGLALKACGLLGLFHCGMALRGARRQKDYKPVFDDWLWHFAVPFTIYAGILAAGIALVFRVDLSLFAVAALQILLLVAGIHNAWDSAVYIATDNPPKT